MGKLQLLVVDDEPGIRSGIHRILENYSVSYPFMEEDFTFNVIEAATGEEGIDIINSTPIDIILLDNKLPGIQGEDVLDYIHKKQMDIVVVMITSYASLELAVNATKKGAFDFVPKPFTPKELRTSIETISKQLFLRRMTTKLNKEGKQIRFQFLSLLSHELKAPINAIEGYLKMMQSKSMGENISDYQEIIDRSIARVEGMRNLILDMLDFTKIEMGKKARELKNINIKPILQTSFDTLQPLSIQKDVDIHFKCNENITFKADNTELEIIFNNLISNGIKYNHKGGRVDVLITKENDCLIVQVQDNGIGINPEDKEKVFNDFVRIKNEQTKNIAGTGLGLAIVKKIVDLYYGNINIESEPGKGTCFTLTLKDE